MPDDEIAAVRDVQLSTAIRGYDRGEVDRYITRVNQLLAELQITAAPESAIQHALSQVTRETRAMIEDARAEAEDITRRSRARADDRVQEATAEVQRLQEAATAEARETREAAERDAREIREAAEAYSREIRERAEARVRALEAEVQVMLDRRDGAIEQLRELAGSLESLVEGDGLEDAPPPEPEPVETAD